MSHTSVRQSSWFERLERLNERWQHSLLVELALIVLLTAFTGVHFLFVLSAG